MDRAFKQKASSNFDRRAEKASRSTKRKRSPVKLRTWDEVNDYFAKHLKPASRGPKGQPIYAHEDVMRLNIIYPDEQS